jgi:hypothetical protein
MGRGPTPKELHREGVFARWGSDCYALMEGGCSDTVQSAHFISCQKLRETRRGVGLSLHRFALDDPRLNLLNASLDDLYADDRNGLPLCFEHHMMFDGKRAKRLEIPAPACVLEFARAYGLMYLLDGPATA